VTVSFHRLAGRAFQLTSGQSESFRHGSYAQALESVMAAAHQQEGIIVITGPAGTGKTTLIEDLAARFRASGARVGRLANALVSGDDLLRLIAFAFGVRADALTKADLLISLGSELAGERPGPARAILIVDEAQDLGPSGLEELRLLCNLTVEPLMQILLVGQDGLWDQLLRPEYAHVHQIVLASCRLRPLAPAETRAYVGHKLTGAGWTGEPRISGEALALIHRYTGGIPRLINLVMGRLLVHAGLGDLRELEPQDAERILLELQRENLAIHLDASAGDPAVSSDLPLQPLGPGYEPDPGVADSEQTVLLDHECALKDGLEPALRGDMPAVDDKPPPLETPHGGLIRKARLAASQDGIRGRMVAIASSRPGAEGSSRTKRASGRWLRDQIGRHRKWSTAAVAAGLALALGGLSSWLASLDLGAGTSPAKASIQRTQIVAGELARKSEGPGAARLAATDNPFIVAGPAGAGSPAEDAIGHPPVAAPDGPASAQPSTEDDAVGTPGPKTPDATIAAGAAEPDRSASGIDRLLARGNQALAENRLTVPKGSSASDYYRAVLARNPDNARAKQGLHQIVLAYGALARRSLSHGDLDDARRFAERGLRIHRSDPTLRSILAQIQQRRRPSEDPAAMLVKRFTEWLHSADSERSFFLSD
jgi:general secretion pathway protein A